jgi:GldM C-terminal domain
MKKTAIFTILISFLIKIQAQTVAVHAEKMNVFYIGTNNPVTIAIEGVADEKIKVTCSGCDISKVEKGHYNVTVSRPGEASVFVEWDGKKEVKKFRVKVIPDPKNVFIGCSICRPEGIANVFENMDFDVQCSIQSYTAMYLPKNGDPIQINNIGSPFNAKIKSLMNKAKMGDRFEFLNIKTRCPGDDAGRDGNTLTYIVKN